MLRLHLTRRNIVRFTFAAAGILLLAGLIAPYIRVDRYGEDIRAGLERTLGRRVEVLEGVTFNLFRGPGFTARKVVIYDDPSAGIEPFADVRELEARVSLTALLIGRLEFSAVRLVEPAVNLVKPESSAWNVQALLARAPGAPTRSLPEIQIEAGRILFKFGDTKSPFFLSDADVLIQPQSGGFYDLRFSGQPSRTDRPARSFGEIRAKGRWKAGSGSRLDLDVEMERSAIEEVAALLRGDAVGLQGMISSRASIRGPLSALAITGRLQTEDFQRSHSLMGRSDGFTLNFRGTGDLRNQTISLATPAELNPGVPLVVRVGASRILSLPQWTAELSLGEVKAPLIMEALRHTGTPLPDNLDLQGRVTGLIAYTASSGMQGQLRIENAELTIGADSRLRIPSTSVLINNDSVRLLPSTLVGDRGQEATIAARYSPQTGAVNAVITGRGLRVADLQGKGGSLLGKAAIPLSDRFRGGTWNGVLQYEQAGGEEGAWRGQFQVRDTTVPVPGLATPLKLLVAALVIDGDRLSVRGFRAQAGELICTGEYRYEDRAQRPHRFNLFLPATDLAQIERLFEPTLDRESSFFTRFRKPAIPDWLRERKADGTLRIGVLRAGEVTLRNVRTDVAWTGTVLELNRLTASVEDGSLSGLASANFAGRDPVYVLKGAAENIGWSGGKVDITSSIETTGTAEQLLSNLKSHGQWKARNVSLGAEHPIRDASGEYTFSISRTIPQVKLSAVEATLGGEHFTGEGMTEPDGRLELSLSSPSRSMRVSGPLLPLKLDMVERSSR